MNSAFVGYEEIKQIWEGVILLDLRNSSYPIQPHSLIAKHFFPTDFHQSKLQ